MGQKKNYHTIRYGTAEGEIKFGHIHTDNVNSAVMLRSGHTFQHYMTMDGPGGEKFRTHSTTFRGPGSFQVKHGDGVPDEQPGIYLDAVNGDIVIRAANGRIRMEALDVDIRATGAGDRGNIVLDANDKVIMNAQTISCNAKVAARFFSEKTVEIIGNNVLNMYGGFMDMADGSSSAVAGKGSKNPTTGILGSAWEIKMKVESVLS
tara:strand:+ start:88 stop:705 length:618 start_codon:yes stop_codon:yes gene_type:complete